MKKFYDSVEIIEGKIGYNFKKVELLKQAFTRKSFAYENGGEHNETLELIGDSVLTACVIKKLVRYFGSFYDCSFTCLNEGTLTEYKKKFISKKMLAHRIDLLCLKDYLLMGNGDIKEHKENESSVKEDLFEAIIGAVALDTNFNYDILEFVVNKMLNIDFYLEAGFDEKVDHEIVNMLQNYIQKIYGITPIYEFVELTGGGFNAFVNVQTSKGIVTYSGTGLSKKEARADAATTAYYDIYNNEDKFYLFDRISSNVTLENSINILQELWQKQIIGMAAYNYIENKDENGNPVFTCICSIENTDLSFSACSSTKKAAKKQAAFLTLCKFLEISK